MNLGFKDKFVPAIVVGTKIHTIREDNKDRWKVGNLIHFCTGLRTKEYQLFRKGTVKEVKSITIFIDTIGNLNVLINGNSLNLIEINQLAIDDGFKDSTEFCEFFFPKLKPPYKRKKTIESKDEILKELLNANYRFFGKLIYWK